jgi:hypothetical protein
MIYENRKTLCFVKKVYVLLKMEIQIKEGKE